MSREPQPWDVSDCGPSDIEREAAKERRRARREIPDRGVPTIEVGADLPAVIHASVAALARRGTVYQRAGLLVEPSVPDEGKGALQRDPAAVVARPLTRGRLREILGESATFCAVRRREGESDRVPIQPPVTLAAELLERGRYEGVPHLERIVPGPFVRDGKLIASPGFDRDTGTLSVFDPGTFPAIPEKPTAADVREAGQILTEWMADFPLATAEDRSAAIACLIECVVGPHIDGPRPMRFVEASAAGSGKGLFVTACEIIGTGVAPAVVANVEPEELRKLLLALAVSGDASVLIDNVVGPFGSGMLAAAVTGRSLKGRMLGANVIVTAPLHLGWWATGNAPTYVHDMGRRVLPVRLNPGCMFPEDRTGFRFPDLVRHVREHRGRYYMAALTLALAHHRAGRPEHGMAAWGSFEAWDRAVRSPMVWADLGDPLVARHRLREKADGELNILRQVHAVWSTRFPNGGTTRDALTRARAGDGEVADLLAALDPKRPSDPSPVVVGRRLGTFVDRIVDDYQGGALVGRHRLVMLGGHASQPIWRVESVLQDGDGGDGGDPSTLHAGDPPPLSRVDGREASPPTPPSPPTQHRNGHVPPAGPEDLEERRAIAEDGAP